MNRVPVRRLPGWPGRVGRVGSAGRERPEGTALACGGNERGNDRWSTFERLSVDDSPEPRVPVLESRGVGLPAVQPVFKGGLLCQQVAENGMEMIELRRVVRAHVNHLLVQVLVAQGLSLRGKRGCLVPKDQ